MRFGLLGTYDDLISRQKLSKCGSNENYKNNNLMEMTEACINPLA
jgi:hypothetical protein